ncbi:nuclear transport factor 2 family protein [Sphingomonas bacterium]|uniref:nuclear transport factor 2 family protein n=1 Tax=Sphingomonas bacterium TaxID=1895847 RepID=UPI00157620E6|nr:nuclear transport factor 2 family protein [Sphingomonas bacterium]
MTSRIEGTPPSIDELAIERLIRRWIVFRDNGLWDELRQIWHLNGQMVAGWRAGTADEFIAASKAGWAKGLSVTHELGAVAIWLQGDRAISQNKMQITLGGELSGVACASSTMARHLDRWEKREGLWGLLSRETIYDRDHLYALKPGDHIEVENDLYESFPPAYRAIGYFMTKMGYPVSTEVPVLRSDAERNRIAEAHRWLRQEDAV